MAKQKAPGPPRPKPEAEAETPLPENPLAVFRQLVRMMWANPALGVVCLHGEPQAGKTTEFITLGRADGRWHAIFTAQSYAPEDIIGYHYREGGRLYLTNPPFIRPEDWEGDQPGLIIVDEMSRPRQENQSILLRLLAERALGTHTLRPNIALACAMNRPEQALIEALLARVLFIGWPLEGHDLLTHFGMRATKHAFAKVWTPSPTNHQFPLRPKTPGAGQKLDLWVQEPAFWESALMRRWVTHGLFPAEAAAALLHDLETERPIVSPVTWVEKVDAAHAAMGLIPMMHAAGSMNLVVPFARALEVRLKDDPTGEWERIIVALSEEKVRVLGCSSDATPEEVETATQSLLEALKK